MSEREDVSKMITYLVHARNCRTWIENVIDIFDPQGKENKRRTLDECIKGVLTPRAFSQAKKKQSFHLKS